MAIYPLIDGPCPYQDRLAEIMDGDMCRMCKREVHDLTVMSDGERRTFLKACSGEVCVSYRISATAAVALTALAATMAAAPAAFAQEQQVVVAKANPDRDVVVITAGRVAAPQDVPIAVVAIEDLVEDAPQPPAKSEPTQKPPPKAAGNKPLPK